MYRFLLNKCASSGRDSGRIPQHQRRPSAPHHLESNGCRNLNAQTGAHSSDGAEYSKAGCTNAQLPGPGVRRGVTDDRDFSKSQGRQSLFQKSAKMPPVLHIFSLESRIASLGATQVATVGKSAEQSIVVESPGCLLFDACPLWSYR